MIRRHRRELPVRRAPGAVLCAARGITVSLGHRDVLAGVDVDLRAGELVALVGPNAAGKSTLLAALAGDIAVASGTVELDGAEMSTWAARDLAQRRAVLPQHVGVSFPFPVLEVVRMGRWPWSGSEREDGDEAAVRTAMEESDTLHLADRPFSALSGGERARVSLARVLAQETQVIVLDEPTAALDIHHQEVVLSTMQARARRGAAVAVVVHDLTLAAAWADRVVVVAEGRVAADGVPASVLTEQLLSRVYRHDVEVLSHPRSGHPVVTARRDDAACVVREDRDKVS